jgi:hypothetical protein
MLQGLDIQLRSPLVSERISLNMVVGTMLIILRALMVFPAPDFKFRKYVLIE